NVASLLLARAMAREQELALRSALGADRGKLIRLLLTESVVLFVAGGTLGMLVASWGVNALRSFGLSGLPRAFDVRLDGTMLGLTLLCALGAGLLFGLLPAVSASRGDAAGALKEAGARGSAGRRTQRLRSVLVVTEIALAVMLLSTAALLIKSFGRLEAQNPGFDPDHVVTARVDLPDRKYDSPQKKTAFHDAVVAALERQPGVIAVGATDVLPFIPGNFNQGSYSSPDLVLPPGSPQPHGRIHDVDIGYRRALGLTLLRGRWFNDTDRLGGRNVCVVDQLLVDHDWPGQDVIGKRIVRGTGGPGTAPAATIVGVVAPIRTEGLDQPLGKETIYFPLDQGRGDFSTFVIRTSRPTASAAAAIRAAVREADPDLSVFDLKTMNERMDDIVQPRRAPMVLLSLFGALALLLAALGVYGVLAFSVTQRRVEFGIRFALGATGRDIAGLVLTQAAQLVVIGIVAGLAGYLALSRVVGQLLFDVSAVDPAMLLVAPAVLALAAFLATLLPVRRATQSDPMIALKAE
ncbi:MAG TPA: FtsX-like permease family protein, partial [Lacipirellulaceae bacterium]|nr:FtsX-like permease family protein [Lacipirellulaceae bacterium]